LGDYLKSGLEVFGLTRKRWLEIKQAFGIKSGGCGCGRRQEQLNRWGDSVRRRLDVLTKWLGKGWWKRAG
jgi:hypothetical protein